jgi:hypothetical protein
MNATADARIPVGYRAPNVYGLITAFSLNGGRAAACAGPRGTRRPQAGPGPFIYALPAAVVTRMNKLLAEGDRGGVVEALFRSVEKISDEDALRSARSIGNLIELFQRLLCDIGSSRSSCVSIARMIHLLRLTLQIVLLRVKK